MKGRANWILALSQGRGWTATALSPAGAGQVRGQLSAGVRCQVPDSPPATWSHYPLAWRSSKSKTKFENRPIAHGLLIASRGRSRT